MRYFSEEKIVEFPLNPKQSLSDLFQQIRKSFNLTSSDRWFLGLPLRYFTLVSFSLPSAAMDSLDQAVKYALMRHVPYELDMAYISYDHSERSGLVDISAIISLRESIDPFLKAAQASGITLYSVFPSLVLRAKTVGDGVFVSRDSQYGESLVHLDTRIVVQNWGQVQKDNDIQFWEETGRLLDNIPQLPSAFYLWQCRTDGDRIAEMLGREFKETIHLTSDSGDFFWEKNHMAGYTINLLPDMVIKQQKIMNYLVLGAIIFFILSLSFFPLSKLVGQKRHLSKLEQRIERVNSQANELRQLREESNALITSIETMAEMKKAYPSAINILRELTEVMPETAWLISLSYSKKQITIQGEADSATAVIEAVENSPFFREVRFSRPVTKSGDKDRFTLIAEVVS